jgi:hypothetical protein
VQTKIARNPIKAGPRDGLKKFSILRLVADVDVYARRMDVNSGTAVIVVGVVTVLDRGRVGTFDASGDAFSAIADLLARAFGICGLGQHEPQRGRNHAE